MNAVTPSSPAAEISLSSEGETENGRPAEQSVAKPRLALQADAERIKDGVARLTSNSIDDLEGLMSELQHLQEFLKCEVERVQGEIESALAGINIIVETIAPWKALSVPVAPAPTNTRPTRSGPAANIEALQSRR
jgi:hypothetical protein